MKNNIHIIYLPGLGDRYDPFRRFLLSLWRYVNVSVELVPMRWESHEALPDKLARIANAIDEASSKRVVLLGESAGGSVTMIMYAKQGNNLAGAMTICGNNHGSNNVSPRLYNKNPAFRDAMTSADRSVEQLSQEACRSFISIHPTYDPVVPVRETLLPRCKEVVLLSVGHLLPIIEALTISSWRVVKAARALNT
jgi:hypothetical protein